MSKVRKQYVARLVGRIAVLLLSVGLWIRYPESFTILEGANFFRQFSVFHLLWVIWVADMLLQIIPLKNRVPIALGSLKLFASQFRPIRENLNSQKLRQYVISTTKSAYKVLLLWGALVAVLGILYHSGVLNKTALLMTSIVFYVCDLICVLIWCPFRLIMKNKCCTTCRIFNWDHMMMFSPLVFAGGFYATSLVVLAFLAWLVWELCVMMYPERFFEMTNASLRCSECTDKLCTQYCRKLR